MSHEKYTHLPKGGVQSPSTGRAPLPRPSSVEPSFRPTRLQGRRRLTMSLSCPSRDMPEELGCSSPRVLPGESSTSSCPAYRDMAWVCVSCQSPLGSLRGVLLAPH